MTTKAAITATAGQWELTGIEATTGQCDCCSRQLTQRVFQVTHSDHGAVQLGRRCAAKATGYKANRIEEALRVARRVAEVARRREIVGAEYPAIAAEFDAVNAEAARLREAGLNPEAAYRLMTKGADLFQTATIEDGWWGDRNRTAYTSYRDYIDAHLPVA